MACNTSLGSEQWASRSDHGLLAVVAKKFLSSAYEIHSFENNNTSPNALLDTLRSFVSLQLVLALRNQRASSKLLPTCHIILLEMAVYKNANQRLALEADAAS